MASNLFGEALVFALTLHIIFWILQFPAHAFWPAGSGFLGTSSSPWAFHCKHFSLLLQILPLTNTELHHYCWALQVLDWILEISSIHLNINLLYLTLWVDIVNFCVLH